MNRYLALSIALLAIAGCERNAVILPNSDSSLNKPAKVFAQEAAARFPYPADIERGGQLPVNAEIGYMVDVITIVNYSKTDWTNVELWVNKSYVIPLAVLESNKTEGAKAKRIPFKIIYNDQGQHFPSSGATVDTLELKMNGKLYEVPKQIGG
jgi:hypothetical protein